MIVIPAIDIREGRCVRLLRGNPALETVYSDDPIEMAHQWKQKGATRLHVVDLDGAFSGEIKNLHLVVQIKIETNLMVEYGGGIRKLEDVRKALEEGIDRVLIGTAFLKDPDLVKQAQETYKERIMIALDADKEMIAVEGWQEASKIKVPDAVRTVEGMGIKEIIFTDISKDGTLQGPNIEAIKRVTGMTKMKVFASGGVGSIDDIQRLKTTGAAGCIVGKSLYSGALDLTKAIAAAAHVAE